MSVDLTYFRMVHIFQRQVGTCSFENVSFIEVTASYWISTLKRGIALGIELFQVQCSNLFNFNFNLKITNAGTKMKLRAQQNQITQQQVQQRQIISRFDWGNMQNFHLFTAD